MHHQQPQEVELTGRKLDRAPLAVDLATAFVHDNVLDLQLRAGVRIPPAHDRPNPCQQLAEVKRLDQVIVRADLKPLDPIRNLVFGGKNDHPCVLIAPDGLGDRQPIELRHHHIEDDHVRLELTDQPQRGLPVGRRLHLKSLVLQPQPEEVHDAALIVDDEHPRVADRRRVRGRFRHLSPNITALTAKSHYRRRFSGGSQQARGRAIPAGKLFRCSRLTRSRVLV